jgi:hypothetical protein
MLVEGSEFAYTQDAMVLDELLDRIISIGKANRNKSTENVVIDGGNNE